MTRKTTALQLLILLMAAGMAVASAGDSANGHGTFSGTSFVFDAKETGSSTITGKASFYDGGSLDLHIEVDCLIVSGNTAIIGGTDAADPSDTYAFKVTDNGGGSPADRITLPQFGQTCATFNTLGSSALSSGDIVVVDQP